MPHTPYLAQDVSPSEPTLTDASRTVADMVESVTERGARLDDAAAVSLVSVGPPKICM